MGREDFESYYKKLLDDPAISLEDRMATCVEMIAIKISEAVSSVAKSLSPKQRKKGQAPEIQMVATGGGAHNKFLIQQLRQRLQGICAVVIPNKLVVDFKEALIFAYLGLLRMKKMTNCIKTVTGSAANNCGGCIYYHK